MLFFYFSPSSSEHSVIEQNVIFVNIIRREERRNRSANEDTAYDSLITFYVNQFSIFGMIISR